MENIMLLFPLRDESWSPVTYQSETTVNDLTGFTERMWIFLFNIYFFIFVYFVLVKLCGTCCSEKPLNGHFGHSKLKCVLWSWPFPVSIPCVFLIRWLDGSYFDSFHFYLFFSGVLLSKMATFDVNTTIQTNGSAFYCKFQEDFKYILLPVSYALVFVIGLALNAMALYVMVFRTKTWKPSTIYMFNLTMCDTLYILTLPFLVYYYADENDWPFTEPLCKIIRFLFYANLYGTVLTDPDSTDWYMIWCNYSSVLFWTPAYHNKVQNGIMHKNTVVLWLVSHLLTRRGRGLSPLLQPPSGVSWDVLASVL